MCAATDPAPYGTDFVWFYMRSRSYALPCRVQDSEAPVPNKIGRSPLLTELLSGQTTCASG